MKVKSILNKTISLLLAFSVLVSNINAAYAVGEAPLLDGDLFVEDSQVSSAELGSGFSDDLSSSQDSLTGEGGGETADGLPGEYSVTESDAAGDTAGDAVGDTAGDAVGNTAGDAEGDDIGGHGDNQTSFDKEIAGAEASSLGSDDSASSDSGENSLDTGAPIISGFSGSAIAADTVRAADYSDWVYSLSESGVVITGYNNNNKYIEVPAVIDDLPVIAIEAYAFDNYSRLIHVTIPDSVTYISPYAVWQKDNAILRSAVLEDVDSYVAAYARENSIRFLPLGQEEPPFATVISTDADGSYIDITSFYGNDSELVIPDSMYGFPVKGISDNAFAGNNALTSAMLPDSVIYMGSDVFSDCKNLTEVSLPSTMSVIPDRMFMNCSSLTGISFPEGMNSIGSRAFSDCTGLTSLVFPEGINNIGSRAFSGCTGLTSLVFPEGINNIGSSAFSGCTGLTSVEIPAGLSVINNSVFSDCTGLTSVELKEGLTDINDYAFSNTGLTSVTLPAGINYISYSAFFGCAAIEELTFSEGIVNFTSDIFSSCKNLTTVNIPSTMVYLDIYQFENLAKILSFNVAEGNANYSDLDGALLNADKTMLYLYPRAKEEAVFEFPDTVTAFNSKAFGAAVNLNEIKINAALVDINFAAFGGAVNLKDITVAQDNPDYSSVSGSVLSKDGTVLKYVPAGKQAEGYNVPATVTFIENSAFRDCFDLPYITIQDGVTLADYVFVNNPDIIIRANADNDYIKTYAKDNNLKFAATNVNLPVVDFEYVVYNGTAEITKYTGNSSGVVIPEEIYGCTVTVIQNDAFKDNTEIVSVVIPDTVTSIGTHAFSGCTGLEAVTISNNLISMGDGAFRDCKKLTEVQFPDSLTHFPYETFAGCTSLKEVILGERLLVIYGRAFSGCVNLEAIELPDTLVGIYSEAFYGTGLKEIIIPEAVESIGDSAFSNCKSLESVELPDALNTINYAAFRNCTALKSIVFPTEMVSVYESVFEGCTGLTTVTPPLSVSGYWSNTVFENCPNLSHLILPEGLEEINGGLFDNYRNITTVSIPASVNSISADAFVNLPKLTAIIIDENNEDYIITPSGLLLDKSGENILYYLAAQDDAKLTIPEGVTGIQAGIFDGAVFTEISIPGSVVSIDDRAFSGCANLSVISVAKNNTAFSDIDGVLCNKDGNRLIYIPAGFTSAVFEVPEDITAISDNAFSDLTALTIVIFHGGVAEIGDFAFSSFPEVILRAPAANTYVKDYALAKQLRYVAVGDELPEDIFSFARVSGEVGSSVRITGFKNNVNVKDVVIPAEIYGYTVDAVDAGAFKNNKTLTSVVISEGVKSVYPEAFSGCSALNTVVLPESLVGIMQNAFYACSSLTTISIPENASIEPYAFASCSGLSSIKLPESLTEISEGVFYDCTSLMSVDIPENVTRIGLGAFSGCTSLVSLIIPEKVSALASGAFSGCTSLVSINIPDAVTYIPNSLFENCSKLVSVKIPDGVTEIGLNAFKRCSSLTRVTLPAALTFVGESAFGYCSNLSSVSIAAGETPLVLGSNAFRDCSALKFITIPNRVTQLSSNVFRGSGLTDINFENGTQELILSTLAFSSIANLKSITIPGRVKSVPVSTFDSSMKLETITFESGVETLASGVFSGCGGLVTVNIPDTVSSVTVSHFNNQSKISYINIDEANPNYKSVDGVVFNKAGDEIIYYPGGRPAGEYSIPEGVATIVPNSFKGANNIKTLYIPASVTEIRYDTNNNISVFNGCGGLTNIVVDEANEVFASIDGVLTNKSKTALIYVPVGGAVTEFTVPEGITAINDYAFRDCTKLVTVVIPDDVVTIDANAFYNFWSMTISGYRGSAAETFANNNGFTFLPIGEKPVQSDFYYYDMDDFVVISGYSGSSQDVVIPSEIDGKPVAEIGGWAFASMYNIRTIKIPDSVTKIGEYAFYYCSELTYADIPDSVTIIDNSAFNYCYNLVSAGTPGGLTYLGINAFNNCFRLNSFTIPGTLDIIGQNAFYGCSALTSLTIEDGVKEIGGNAFHNCSSLTSVTIPGSVERIGISAFSGCSALTSLIIEDGVKEIEGNAFYNCTSLKTAEIPESLESIGYSAFFECKKLESITIPEGITAINDSVFSGCLSLKTVNLPESLQYISNNAFYDCSSLTSFTAPDKLTYIGSYAFYRCTALSELVLNDGLATIGNYAFNYASSLKSVVIPGTVTSIGSDLFISAGIEEITISDGIQNLYYNFFSGLDDLVTINIPASITSFSYDNLRNRMKLENVFVAPLNRNYRDIDGVLFDKNQTQLLVYPLGRTQSQYTIPSGVTSIDSNTFSNADSLKSISIPSTVSYIAYNSFVGCSNLETLDVNSKNSFFSSNGGTLFDKRGDRLLIVLPDAAGEEYVVPENVTAIEYGAFYGCPNMKSVVIHDDVTEISGGLFYNSGNIIIRANKGSYAETYAKENNILVAPLGAEEQAVDFTFRFDYDKIAITGYTGNSSGVIIPSSVYGVPVTQIEDAFRNNKTITSVTIPGTVTLIYQNAFAGCTALEEVIFAEGTAELYVYNDAFANCTALESITLPGRMKNVSNSLFYGSTALKTVTLLSGIEKLYASTFSNTGGITAINLPDTLLTLDTDYLGIYCSKLESINVDQNNPNMASVDGVLLSKDLSRILYYPMGRTDSVYTIPDGVKEIKQGLFITQFLVTVNLPASLTDISFSAFSSATKLTDIFVDEANEVYTSENGILILKKDQSMFYVPKGKQKAAFVVPEGVKTINSDVFADWSTLTSIEIPAGTENIAEGTFVRFGNSNLLIRGHKGTAAEAFAKKYGYRFLAAGEKEPVIEYTYTIISNNSIRLNKYTGNNVNAVIPSVIYGMDVVEIADNAFSDNSSLISVIIPDSITKIGAYAFSDCSSLTSVTIPDSVASIGEYAFSGCSKLESVALPSGLKSIDSYLFNNCYALTSVPIPEGVASIGDYAFDGCRKLDNVVIPDSVKSIGNYAFSNCAALKSVTLPAGLKAINKSLFEACGELTAVTLPDSIITIGDSAFANCSKLNNVTIPANVASIGADAFAYCVGLTEISIPENVIYVGAGAFSYCSLLSGVSVAEGVEFIGNGVFSNNNSLKSVTLPGSIVNVSDDMFDYSSALETVTFASGITALASSVFTGCSSLTTVKIPASMVSLPVESFAGANKLKTFEVAEGNKSFSSIDGVLMDGNGTRIIYYPLGRGETEYSIPEGVTTLTAANFNGASLLRDIYIPKTVNSISPAAFSGAASLVSVKVDEDNTNYADVGGILTDNDKLSVYYVPAARQWEELVIPKGITAIKKDAFIDCYGLTFLLIPASVVSIDKGTFDNCPSVLIRGVDGSYAENYAKENALNFLSIYDEKAPENFNYSIKEDGTVMIRGYTGYDSDIEVPDSIYGYPVNEIDDYAFYGSNASSIKLPDSITAIGNSAFEACRALTSVDIPEGVTSIGNYAFQNCISLTSVVIPEGVTSIGDYTFRYCYSLTSVVIPEGITSIGSYAFQSCSSLTSVVIPEGVTSIGSCAFQNCTSLTSVVIPEGVTEIRYYTFENCTSLKSIKIPKGVKTIESGAFYYCISLTDVEIPDSVVSIGGYTFAYCYALTDVEIPDSVITLGDNVFYECNGLTSVKLSEKLSTIPAYTFYRCSKLKSVVIPNSVTDIYNYAFRYCTALEAVTIGAGVNSITYSAFYDTYSLTTVTLSSGMKNITDSILSVFSNTTTLNIPDTIENININAFDSLWALAKINVHGDNQYYSSADGVLFNKDKTVILKYPLRQAGGRYVVPASVTTIPEKSFANAADLVEIEIPAATTSIDYHGFEACSNLMAVRVDENNETYSDVDGALLSKDGTALLFVPGGIQGEYTVPDGVTTISDGAFSYCDNVTTVIMPDSVSFIDASVFSNLYNVTLRASENNTYIKEYADSNSLPFAPTGAPVEGKDFSYSIYGDSITITGYNGTSQALEIPDSIYGRPVKAIGSYAFSYNEFITSVKIPGSVTEISSVAFYSAKNLRTVTLEEGLQTISSSAFSYCTALTTISLPASVKNINSSAFSNCTVLASITLNEGLTSIASGAFANCSALEFISIPGTVKSIPNNLFDGAVSLKTIKYNSGTVDIGNSPFSGCTNLESVEIPDTVTKLESWFFSSCSKLTDIKVDAGNELYCDVGGVLYNKDKTSIICYPKGKKNTKYVIPDTISTLEANIFNGNQSLSEIVINANIESISQNAFNNLPKLAKISVDPNNRIYSSLEGALVLKEEAALYYVPAAGRNGEYIIPEGIKAIRNGAFADFPFLNSVVIHRDVTAIDSHTFGLFGVSLMIRGYKDSYAEKYAAENGLLFFAADEKLPSIDFDYWVSDEDNSIAITNYTGKAYKVEIPSEIFGLPVKSISSFAFNNQRVTEVIIPEGVERIEGMAFNNATDLVKVTIPSTVSYIGYSAFMGCTYLSSAEIPEGVTVIADSLFDGCANLLSVKLPSTVTAIETAAFSGCVRLSGVVLPEGLKTIGNGAFNNCKGLTALSIPDSVTGIGSNAFSNCSALKSIKLSEKLTEVSSFMFSYCSSLETVAIPAGVTSIGSQAFIYCSKLASVTLPQGLLSIGDSAFNGSAALTDITIPGTVTYFGANIFGNCPSLESINFSAGLRSIPQSLLGGCTGLSDITVPETVRSIDIGAFATCEKLVNITVHENNSKYCDINGVLFDKEQGKLIYYPQGKTEATYTVPDEIEIIASGAFQYAKNLTKIELPKTVMSIHSGAFATAGNLYTISVDAENPKYSDADGALANHNGTVLQYVPEGRSGETYTVPTGVTSIVKGSFDDCVPLKTVVIPSAVVSIDKGVFDRHVNITICANDPSYAKDYALEYGIRFVRISEEILPVDFSYRIVGNTIEITAYNGTERDVIIPGRIHGLPVTSVAENAFNGRMDINSVELSENIVGIGTRAFYNCMNIARVKLPESLKTIGNYSFYGNVALTSLTVPKGVETIGEYAFYGCTGLTGLTIEKGVLNIDKYAFRGCNSLTELELPEGIVTLGTYAFSYCTDLTSVSIPSSITSYGDYVFNQCTALTDVTFAEGLKVIGSYLFYGCVNLKSVIIPDSVENIGARAFSGCSSLETVNIPSGVTTIGSYVFNNCISLKDVRLGDGLKNLGSNTFYGCTSLETIEIPNSVTTIGSSTFYNCTSLKAIELPDSVTSIGSYAFRNCFSLEAITIGGNIKSVPDSVFAGCTALKDVIISEGVTTIVYSAFLDCTALEAIEIPSSVSSVSSFAFEGCTALTDIKVAEGNRYYSDIDGVLFNKAQTYPVCYPLGKTAEVYQIPESVKDFDIETFVSSEYLTGIVVPAGVSDIYLGYSIAESDSLTSITVSEDNEYYSDIDGVLFSKDGSVMYCLPPGRGSEEYVIPEGVTGIKSNAFNLARVPSVLIHAGVTSIEGDLENYNYDIIIRGYKNSYAERYAKEHRLKFVVVESEYSDEFYYYGNGNGNITITGYKGSSAAITIPSNYFGFTVTAIDTYAFENLKNVKTITIPETVTYINVDTFIGIDTLTLIKLSGNNPNYSEIDGVLFNKEQTEILFYPPAKQATAFTIPETVKTIGRYAFYHSAALKSVVIPEGVESIEESAFGFSDKLVEISLPDTLISLGDSAFSSCTSLAEITIPASVASFGGSAFEYCTALEKVVINRGVTNIGNSAFADCALITELSIPESVLSIGDYAFKGCIGLTELTFSDKLQTIGTLAFLGCTGLTSVTFGEDLRTIGDGGFAGCTGITTVDIPARVSRFGTGTFAGCEGLTAINVDDANPYLTDKDGVLFNNLQTELIYYPEGIAAAEYTIPEGVTTIKSGAISGSKTLATLIVPSTLSTISSNNVAYCYSLNEFVVAENNPYLSEIDGVLTDKSESHLLYFPPARQGSEYTIPNEIDTIVLGSFRYCEEMTSLIVPEHVTKIDSRVFGYIPNLIIRGYKDSFAERFAVSDGVRFLAIEDNHPDIDFEYEIIGTTIMLTDYIGTSSEVIIPKEIYNLPVTRLAFPGNDNITSVKIHEGITYISSPIFGASSSLTSITVDKLNPQFLDDDGVLFNRQKSNLLHYPAAKEGAEYTVPLSVTAILSGAFINNANLKTIKLQRKVSSVAANSFYNSGEITEIIVDEANVNYSAEDGILFNKNKTNLIYYPNAKAGTKYDIPENVTSISAFAFYRNRNLTDVAVDENVGYIGTLAFAGGESLESITVDENNKYYSDSDGVLFNLEQDDLICYPANRPGTQYTTPTTVTYIYDYAFYANKNLTKVTLTDGVKDIDDNAFDSIAGTIAVVIPYSVERIMSTAFNNSPNVTIHGIRGSYAEIFAQLYEIPFVATGNLPEETDKDYTYVILPDDTVKITKYNGTDESVTIPDIISGLPVTVIGANAFAYKSAIKTVVISQYVTTIEDNAFRSCSKLTSVVIPRNTVNIADTAITARSNLIISGYRGTAAENYAAEKGIIFKALDSVEPNEAFTYKEISAETIEITGYNGVALSVVIPAEIDGKKVIRIADEAFKNTNLMQYVTISEGIVTIGKSAFVGCTDLISVSVPKSVLIIEAGAFERCTSLTTILLSGENPNFSVADGVLYDKAQAKLLLYPIGSTLKKFVIPEGVTEIADYAFANSSRLNSLTINNDDIVIGDNAFKDCANLTLYVTSGSAGEAFAKENGIFYQIISEYQYNDGEIILSGSVPEDAELVVTPEEELDEKLLGAITDTFISMNEASEDAVVIRNFKAYDIILMQGDEQVQPTEGKVRVAIDLPRRFHKNYTEVYRMSDTGEVEAKMTGEVINGKIYFETEHFSLYVLVDTNPAEIGNVDGLNGIDEADVIAMLQYTVGANSNIVFANSDLDMNEVLDNRDAVYLLRALAGYKPNATDIFGLTA